MYTPAVRLTLVSKPECYLCVEAQQVIQRVLDAAAEREIDIDYDEINIFENDELAEKYGDEIPVVLINDMPYASFQVHEDKLAYAILHERSKMRAKANRRAWWRRGKK
ncbi:glutaredoxin family protein [Canibacter sp. lx-45]|uniref:glutaredoxin family protein n=1 Tax=Canibacter zhuwentaonis TaxID=2837491 RepID=UPI001BDBCAAE|nr:glutaredoxin family protein [Canibacter zhuwentaonis]MBT1035744.1 glutaredoxin family protein [Canibacter zhuwentaonis]